MLNPKPPTTEKLRGALADAVVIDFGATQSTELGYPPTNAQMTVALRPVLWRVKIILAAEPAPTAEHLQFKAEIEALALKWGVVAL